MRFDTNAIGFGKRATAALGAAAALATIIGLDAAATEAAAARRGGEVELPDLVTSLSPAVVNVSSSVRRAGQPDLSGPAQRMQRKLAGQAVSLGSGFIIDPSGVVVTNNHVIDNADDIKVTLNDGREFSGRVRATDRETDIAIVQLETGGARLPYVEFGDSDAVRVGEDVFAIGNPFGLGGTVTKGIVSARNRDIDAGSFDDFIQTDAAINRGNSGGPLFNMEGKVVGVNTAIYSQTGGSVGVGFAVPASLAKIVTDQLLKFGETRRGWLGVSIDEMTQKYASELGFARPRGAIVTVVRPDSPALKGGLKPNDVILTFNRHEVNGVRDLTRAVAETPVGATVPVEIIRTQKRMTLQVTVDRRETNILAGNLSGPLPAGAVQSAGVTLQQPSPEVLAAFDLPRDTEGVVVTEVDPASQAAIVLRPGDVILEIGWERVLRPEAAADKLEKLRNLNSGPVLVYIQRGDRLFFDSLRP
ncbi:MAG: Do family serine endopeptidase [Alphaproteobacteria bacterium]|nr:Do family serine endopeptidase [Alphaproteobacteria bacterium]